MASASSGHLSPAYRPAPLKRASRSGSVAPEDDSQDEDPVAEHSNEQAVFADDPLDGDLGGNFAPKGKHKNAASLLMSALSGDRPHSRSSPSPAQGILRAIDGRLPGSDEPHASSEDNAGQDFAKDGAPLDWYVEGPGRRVGYEDLTAIDWIFEYTKERQRLRNLYTSATGLLGYVQRYLDSSQVWLLLVLTGLLAGTVAAGIDVASDWLGDLKTGYCRSGEDGGHFYLNKYFCCFGYDEWAQCQDWRPWSLALHVTSSGGKWFVEYIFFIVLSVLHLVLLCDTQADVSVGKFRYYG